jgi:hypothetical protein
MDDLVSTYLRVYHMMLTPCMLSQQAHARGSKKKSKHTHATYITNRDYGLFDTIQLLKQLLSVKLSYFRKKNV